MDNGLVFDYFYGAESEQFTFFRIPKLLITDHRFNDLSNDAKLLYGLLLDRMSLSRKNRWFDKENRAYIIYTVEQVMDNMNCANGKASKLLISLEQFGLIERKKPGLGRPAITYVKNFMTIFRDEDIEDEEEDGCNESYPHSYQQEEKPEKPVKSTAVRLSHGKECDNQTPRDAEIECPDMPESHAMECGNRMSADAESARQEMRESHTNNTNNNKTDLSDNDLSHTHSIQTGDATETMDYTRPLKITIAKPEELEGLKERDTYDEKKIYEDLVKENLFYDHYMESFVFTREGKKLFDIMVQRIVRMATDTPEYIMVKDHKVPGQVAKSIFLKLRGEHIMYCIEKIENSGVEIRNPGAYIDALLYSSYTEYEEKDSIDALQAVGAYKKNNLWT